MSGISKFFILLAICFAWHGYGNCVETAATYRVVLGDQASTEVLIFDAAADDWNESEAILWRFQPLLCEEIPEHLRSHFGFISDVKPVLNMSHLLITASSGIVCLVRIDDSKPVFWAIGGNNPHTAELLPDGNIVSLSTGDNIIRLFNVADNTYKDYDYEYPHGAVYDRKRGCLWTNGWFGVTRWEYTDGELIRKETYNPMGEGEGFAGHDLFPAYGADKLLVTGRGFTVFDPETGSFTPMDTSMPELPKIKGISQNGEGQTMVTFSVEGWWTDTVSLYVPGESVTAFRTSKSRKIYKARWMLPNPFSYDE